MAFKPASQKFNAQINSVVVGNGDGAVALGGSNVLPFYTFDGSIGNAPKIGVEITDIVTDARADGIRDYYAAAETLSDVAKRAEAIPGADFVCLVLEGADPNGANRSVEECVADAVAVSDALTKPLVIMGCGNVDKDAQLFETIAGSLTGRNVLFLSAREENYKQVGAAAGLAYAHKVGAESAVDINLAKQLNVLLTQLGVKQSSIVMNLGSAAAGYGFEYVASTIERVKLAALGQSDAMLAMPVITNVASETWSVKESLVEQSDMPEWGSRETRGIAMEVSTAAACLASGSDAVILRHPESVRAISAMIERLV